MTTAALRFPAAQKPVEGDEQRQEQQPESYGDRLTHWRRRPPDS